MREPELKMVVLMYLQEDEACVGRLLSEVGIEQYSRLSMEGTGPGAEAGWYGEVAPYESRMVFALMPEDRAAEVLDAVSRCRGVEDPRHPIRAAQLPVEATTACECEDSGRSGSGPDVAV